ncbi:MAG: hypothetical protein IKS17_03495 [Firmicutes bacterium]|nr:hypothetical protein [Bacillota bacterium]
MEMQKNRKIDLSLTAALLLTAFCIFVTIFHQENFDADNVIISMAVNRLYSEENYCLFLNPLLCGIIRPISGLLPNADILKLMMFVMYWLSVFCFSRVCFKCNIGTAVKILLGISLIPLILVNAIFINFTVAAAYFGMAGFTVIFIALKHGHGRSYGIAGLILILFGTMLRQEAVLLMLPFALLHVFTEAAISLHAGKGLLRDKKRRSAAVWVLVCLLCITALSLYHNAVNSSQKYLDGSLYNRYRAEIVDYDTLAYPETSGEFQKNVSENDYDAAKKMLLADTRIMTADYLKYIAENTAAAAYAPTFENLKNIFVYALTLKYGRPHWQSVVLTVRIMFLFVLLVKIRKVYKAEALAAALGAVLMVMYFVFIGRLMDRIYISAMLGCFFCFVLCITSHPTTRGKNRLLYLMFPAMAAAVTVGFLCYSQMGLVRRAYNVFDTNTGADESVFEFTYTDNSLYLWDPYKYDFIAMMYFTNQNKLPSRRFLQHNIPVGEWTYAQPYFNDHLEGIGAQDPLHALIYRDDVYYISEDPTTLYTYIQEHYEPDIQIECTAALNKNVYIWRFTPPIE